MRRVPILLCTALALASAGLAAAAPAAPVRAKAVVAMPVADHHQYVFSPAAAAYLPLIEATGPFHAAMDRLEAFASENGARWYGLPLNGGTVTLVRGGELVPERVGDVVPFHAGERLGWRVEA